ncbi:MAG: zinc-ribbon domain-containing protein, partial [Myxococcota bacterium]
MIVECPSCSTRFNLDESRIGERGAKVRCSVCSHSFVVHASVQNQVPMQDEITEVGGGLVDPSMVDPSFMPTDSVQIPAPLDMSATVPGGAAYIDHANTAPGPQPLSSNDLIEIDASEVAELDDSTGTMPSPILTTETVPGVEVNAIPETIDFEEVSGSRPSPLVETDVHDAFGDPFASDGMFGDEMRQVESLAPLDDDGDFESHATAVYDV